MRFTDRTIQGIKSKADRFELFEDSGRGFGLRVAPTGRKTWITLYRFDGKPRRLSHGAYPSVSLAQARRKHATALADVEQGVDPGATKAEARKAASGALSFAQLVCEYERIEARTLKSGPELVRLLRKDALPEWQHRKAAAIKRRDVVLLIDQVRERAPATAEHLQGRLVRLFNFAAERGIVEDSPVTGLRRRTTSRARDRNLTDAEIKALWSACSDVSALNMSQTVGDALRFILLTGQRPGEVTGAPWSEFEGDLWQIPPGRYKTDRAHAVPLTPLALEILKRRHSDKRARLFPFPSHRVNGTAPIRVDALSKAVRRNIDALGLGAPATPHDLRRTVRTRLAALGVEPVVAEKVIGHTLPGMMRTYDRHEYLDEKRAALEAWEGSLKALLA